MSHLIKLSEEDHCVCSPERICEPQSATCTCPCPLDFSSHIAPFPSHGCPAGLRCRQLRSHLPTSARVTQILNKLALSSACVSAREDVDGWRPQFRGHGELFEDVCSGQRYDGGV